MSIPVIGFAAYSGTGKTTVLEKLIRELTARGLRVGTVKHDGHDFEIDHPGRDSYRHIQAGAGGTGSAPPPWNSQNAPERCQGSSRFLPGRRGSG